MFCTNCGEAINEGEMICKGCGKLSNDIRQELLAMSEKSTAIKCKNCGGPMSPEHKFCGTCGAPAIPA